MEHISLNPTTTKGSELSSDEQFGKALDESLFSADSLEKATAILRENPSLDLHSHLGVWETRGIDKVGMPPSVYKGDAHLKENLEGMIAGINKCAYICFTGDFPLINFAKPGHCGSP
ncbi:hypothetical protein [Rubinisphaera italica]|uniref:Uncharacterized protein n=1 Tax=Rubinisphaera italica TaxID=2527969 RepID=A0A5C5XCY4_9PLAN|nr:hypothetical protein [Rubinisphaera italica]TWT60936.1 hypothetical protein Pan54_16680 [Rubinisphaera italica]